MKVGILTSGGDCSGLNAVMRGIALNLYGQDPATEIIGFRNGYAGLINDDWSMMSRKDFEGILCEGGTILGSTRTPYKQMTIPEEDGVSRLAKMTENYRKNRLECLFALGGAGTHKNAALLCAEGCNVIALPKTIDNDVYGTDYTFGFQTAVGVAAEALQRIRTTAQSHTRTILVEIMGNKAGWLTLYAGIAGAADIILIPEIPFNLDKVVATVKNGYASGKRSMILAVAEGAVLDTEAPYKRKERVFIRTQLGEKTVIPHLAEIIGESTGLETRATSLGYIQRGGEPCAFDKVLCTRLGSYAAQLCREKKYGVAVSLSGNRITFNALADIAGKYKLVDPDSEIVRGAEGIGISFGR